MGMCCRMDLAGVTSFIRVLHLKPTAYPRLLGLFHSNALDLDLLTQGWIRLALSLFNPFEAGVGARSDRSHGRPAPWWGISSSWTWRSRTRGWNGSPGGIEKYLLDISLFMLR
jgi:hypothetical protein